MLCLKQVQRGAAAKMRRADRTEKGKPNRKVGAQNHRSNGSRAYDSGVAGIAFAISESYGRFTAVSLR